MPKFSALKFIDSAILPVALVFGIKLLSIFLLTIVFGFAWSLDGELKNRLLIFSFEKFSEVTIVSTSSDIVMTLVYTLGLAWAVFRATYFRRDRVHPALDVLLRQRSQDALLLSKEDSFHQVTVWLVISWFSLFLIVNNVLVGITSFFVLGLGVGSNLALTLAFYKSLLKS